MKPNQIVTSDSSGIARRAPSVYQVLAYAFLTVGAVLVTAIAFDYGGKIQFKFGADGMHMQVDGNKHQP